MTLACHAIEQVVVDVGTDSDGEDAQRVGQSRDRFENRTLVPDEAVGEEDDLAMHPVDGFAACRVPQSLHQLGAAAAGQPARPLERCIDVDALVGHRASGEARRATTEADQVEAILRLQAAQRVGDELLRRLDRVAAHASRGIEHEHDFFGSCLLGGDLAQRLQQ